VRLSAAVDADEPYLLDLQPALQAMHQQLLSLAAEQRAQAVEAALLRILMPEVARGDPRRSPRRADGRWLEVVIGLEAIHDQLLAGAEAAAGPALRVVDSSAQGMRLSWPQAGELQVGELLALRAEADAPGPRLRLALVRWLRSERDGSTELGVELLPGSPSAVRCRALDSPQAAPWPCLFLPSVTATGGSATLLASRERWQDGRRLLLEVGRREVRVRAMRRVIETACIDGFEFASDSEP
jgi:hypothetical protein